MHVERHSAGEIHIKTTMRSSYTLIRMAQIKMADHTRCWQACKKLKLGYTAGGNIKICSSRKHFSNLKKKKFDIHLPYDPVILLLGTYPSERKMYVYMKTGT